MQAVQPTAPVGATAPAGHTPGDMQTRLPPDWFAQAHAQNPCRPVGDGSDNWLTCPVRLSHPHVFEPYKPKQVDTSGKKPKYETQMLFWQGIGTQEGHVPDFLAPLYMHTLEFAKREFPNNFDPAGNFLGGINLPFRNQRDKMLKSPGYVPGAWFSSAKSEYQPQVLDQNGQPVIDPARIYPGVWVIAQINCYAYKRETTGVAFGLNGMMLYADDNRIAKGGGATAADFGQVSLQQATTADVGAAFGAAPVVPAAGGAPVAPAADPNAAAMAALGIPADDGIPF